MKAKKILTFLPVFVFIATYGFAKPVKQQYKDEKVEVNISFSIPGKWKISLTLTSGLPLPTRAPTVSGHLTPS